MIIFDVRKYRLNVNDVPLKWRYFELLQRRQLFKAIRLYRKNKVSVRILAQQLVTYNILHPEIFKNRRNVFKQFCRYVYRHGKNKEKTLLKLAAHLSLPSSAKRVKWFRVRLTPENLYLIKLSSVLRSGQVKLVFS